MAQLVKLLDYISRYENDLSHYPTQYIRLKKSQWERMKLQWQNGAEFPGREEIPEVEEEQLREGNWLTPLFSLFGRRKEREFEAETDEMDVVTDEVSELENFGFNPYVLSNPGNLEHLRKLFLDQLFHFQLKWASSTLRETSHLSARFMGDNLLRSFTQQLPDSFLLFYYPILQVKKAPVEVDIILVTPLECLCITIVEQEDIAAYVANGDRFWTKKVGTKESRILNPLIGLNRMEKIISGIFSTQGIDFPIKKFVLSRNGYIDYPGSPFDIKIIDRRTYNEWFTSLQQSTFPMKFNQFKAAQSILDNVQTTAFSRLD
ncbi:NERD domain-containing protein [Sporosarcina thermotolerans]|uniref:NERD domain-containing protein n=1 Tax=Sporosarcina thermotolerans TaxID=633404 RepID=A0AAW9A821_9BACL|nr:NERD domain-containing protein [Sporosarcina thermotolerans]MDW0117140.1 NERD domain-containing protein [Sporosarcina thermotolerans]WHT47778.1 NERD domain-containing protein [Sporosarcina thermotolerans]